ncbi:hypothetical protein ACH5RR_011338 [Cinchona calisaya]|uniref:Protein GAMETE EXPRESSED 3 n=1 Tax=Cinchona calisaya TaxID=153742 RepID=A0ABD3A873_9GENT
MILRDWILRQVRSPHYKWIKDFSSFGTRFTVTPANNGLLYVNLPVRALLLALDVSTGNILGQRSTGPLSSEDYASVVDSNGWISIGSLDGFLYSLSPTGSLKKFPKVANLEFVTQVSPVLDCSGYGVYVSQTVMEGKVDHAVGDYAYFSALKPKGVIFTMLVPATRAIYWSESYPPGIGNPLPCCATGQKFASSCSQASAENISIYTSNEKTILLFLLFETTILITLAALIEFCCIFWKKRKLQSRGLGKFLEKRHSLRLQKNAFDRTITELQQKASEEAVDNEVLETLRDLVKEREGIQKKFSTAHSLGRDGAGLQAKSLLPLFDGNARSYSFQGAKKESVTIFHTFSNTNSSSGGSSEDGADEDLHEEKEPSSNAKGKAPVELQSCSDNEIHEK